VSLAEHELEERLTAGASRAGYFDALEDVLDEAREVLADIARGICALPEAANRLEAAFAQAPTAPVPLIAVAG
jgi:hypothetical protein